MPLTRIKLLPVDPAGFETAEPSWDWWDVDPGIKIVMAHLQAQGPTAAPSDVKRLKADANGNLLVSTAGGANPSTVRLVNGSGGTAADPAPMVAEVGSGVGFLPVFVGLFDGISTIWRPRAASAANIATQSGLGAQLIVPAGEWTALATPVAGTAASAVRAAGGAGVRHVCKSIFFSASAAAAPAATTVNVNFRDGGAGAGTILTQLTFLIAAAIGQSIPPFWITGLNIVGSPATAMTTEFNVGVANVIMTAGLTGYDAVV